MSTNLSNTPPENNLAPQSKPPAPILRWGKGILLLAVHGVIEHWGVAAYAAGMGTVLSALYAILAYDSGLSYHWLLLFTVLFFALTFAGIYFLLLLLQKLWRLLIGSNAPQAHRVKSETPVQDAGEKADRIKELEAERDAAVRERDHYRRQAEREQEQAAIHSTRAKRLEAYKWLHDMAEAQARDISRYIRVDVDLIKEDIKSNLEHPMPKVIFGLLITNFSVFDITIDDEKIDGRIEFRGISLEEKKVVLNPVKELRPLQTGHLVLEQRLSPSEKKLISDSEDAIEPNFEFDHLVIHIKERELTPQFKSQPLNLKNKGVNIKGGPLTYGGRAPDKLPAATLEAGIENRPDDEQALDSLKELAKEGAGLLDRCLRHSDNTIHLDITSWEEKTAELIRSFDRPAAYMFLHATLERHPSHFAAPRDRGLIDRMHTRIARLSRIIEKLRRG